MDALLDRHAIRHLSSAGIDVGVGMAPILPGLSDRPEQLEAVVRAAREAGARSIWASVVHLRPGIREHFLEALARDWPDEVARYEQLFANGAYLPATIARPVQEHIRAAARATPVRRRVDTPHGTPSSRTRATDAGRLGRNRPEHPVDSGSA